MSKSPTHTTHSPIIFKSDLTTGSIFRADQQLKFAKNALKIEWQDTELQQPHTEPLMRWNKPLSLEITAATNEVQIKEQEKHHMPSKLNQDHRLSPELELIILENLISSQ